MGATHDSPLRGDTNPSGPRPCKNGHERRPGDPALAVVMLREHAGELVAYAAERVAITGVAHLVEPEELALDAVETLLQPTCCPADAPNALRYLKGVIRNLARRRRRVDRFVRLDARHPDIRRYDAYERAHLALVKRDVAGALESLPPKQRTRSVQHLLDRDKLHEIAADHHVSINTVQTECKRARHRLKQQLAQYDVARGTSAPWGGGGGSAAERS